MDFGNDVVVDNVIKIPAKRVTPTDRNLAGVTLADVSDLDAEASRA